MKSIAFTLLLLLVFCFAQAQSPDFKCGVSFNYGYNKPNKTINLTYDFFNVGGGTNTSFTIAYIASTDMNIDASDYLVDYKAYGSAVANAFATVSFSYAFSDGDLPPGLYNFIMYLDYGNNVTESNETNNIVSFGTFQFEGTPTGIEASSSSLNNTSIYPNPMNNRLQLKSEKLISEIRLTNAKGKIIRVETPGARAYEMETNELNPGIYFMQILFGDGALETRKVIKN